MPKKSIEKDKIRISHVKDSIQKIEKYLGKSSYKDFLNDECLTDALAFQLSIIGEALNHLSDEFKNKYKLLPYKEIVGMRNVIIHEYFRIDRKLVWNSCKHEIPKLKEQIEEIYQFMKSSNKIA
jgi:uncharacterized protein with HEPN domain